MKTFSKKEILKLKLTDSEVCVLKSLKTEAKTLASIEKESKIPHSTVFDSIKSLEKRGLINSLLIGRKKNWSIVSENLEISKSGTNLDVEIYEGRENIIKKIYNLFEKNKGKRVLVYHGPETFSEWYKILEEKEIISFNLLLSKMQIIVERFVPEKSFMKYIKNVSPEYRKSMINRAQITYLLPDIFFTSKSEIILFEEEAIVYEADTVQIVLFKNKETIKMYRNIFEIFKTVGEKIDSQKEFEL